MLGAQGIEEALSALGALLADRSEHFEIVLIGGGALAVVGLIDRATRDVDVVALHEHSRLVPATPLPPALVEAARDVANLLELDPLWLNNGPASMLAFGLPDGFLVRCERRTYGGLVTLLASRLDQIHFKLYAAADDRPDGKHHRDLERLSPTAEELLAAARWTRTHDDSEGFAMMLRGLLALFNVKVDDV